jgi:hypothetical protein
MRVLYDIQDKMEDELKSICRKDEITREDLENCYKIVDIIKDIVTVDAMHKAEHEGYSRDGMNNYSRGWDVDYSYARGRDSMGRYTSRDGSSYNRDNYSRTSKDEMIDHLTGMMRSARTEDERENYRKTIEQLQR